MKASNISLFVLALFSMFLIACGGAPEAEENTATEEPAAAVEEAAEMTMTVDNAASMVKWTGTMLGIKEHFGRINISEGNVMMKGDMVSGGNFTIDMKSIAPMDSAYDAENTPDMLIGHLSSPDFFAVDSFPQAMFTITEAMENMAKGTMTIRGVEGEETVENISISEENGMKMVNGTITFDRKKYGVAWDSPMKEAVLSDDIEVEVTLAVK